MSKNKVSFYHCGPTVYWTQHLGNMRAVVLADLIRRSLEYTGYKVKMARNYTDVGHLTSDEDEGEDKMEKAVKRDKLTPEQVAEKYIKIFAADVIDLNAIVPEFRPRATKHITDIKKTVKILIAKGFAYETKLAIYFAVDKFENYGRLSGQKLDDKASAAGKAKVSDPDKKHPADFALWFFKTGQHQNALQTWPNTPLKDKGEGFPGWHIECSVMSQKYLGDTLDLHMGGIEHIPIHHENEIAQSEATTGKKFVNYWLHNEHLLVNDGKMSKSAGTSYSLAEVKTKGYDPLVLRYFFLGAHYRSKQNFTWEALAGAKSALDNLRTRITELKKNQPGRVSNEYQEEFTKALADDFNVPQALATVWDMLKSAIGENDKLATVLEFDKVLGLRLDEIKTKKIPADIKKLAAEREMARKEKDWRKSDELRDQINKKGFEIEDTPTGHIIKKQ